MKRQVFIISDGTGITAENLGHSLMSQFEEIIFETTTIPYVDSKEKAKKVVEKLNHCFEETGQTPLIFATLVNPTIRNIIKTGKGLMCDLFHTFVKPLESELRAKSSYTVGRSHGVIDSHSYKQRIDALNYTLSHDDGIKISDYCDADIVLVGVSRCGKTPTCLYLAMQFGLLSANYPFTDDDTCYMKLPEKLKPYKKNLFGLTIDSERLASIRNERKPNSRYASLEKCRREVQEVESMFQRERIPYLNTTTYSIEEISTRILAKTGIDRKII